MAESKRLGSLRSPSSLLRKLSYYRLLLTRLRLAKDCKGSNPFFTFKQKTGHSFCYALFFMAESKGFGSLRSPASLLRKLSYYRLLLTRLRLAKDCKGSNPFFTFKQKTGHSFCYALFFMAESKGLGSLRSPSSLLRKLSYYRLLLTRLRLAKDCKGSNPFLIKAKTGHSFCYILLFWRRVRDSNPRSR